MPIKNWIVLALIGFGGIASCYPSNAQIQEARYNTELGAVKVWMGEELSRDKPQPLLPILRLEQDDRLNISFDLLGNEGEQLYYRIRHCDADWRLSSLMPSEYIKGFDGDRLEMPVMSVGTLLPYAHYRLSYPNEFSQPSISGNYLVEIHKLKDSDTPLLAVRFSVLGHSMVSVSELEHARSLPLPADKIQTYQQINLKIEDNSWSYHSRGDICVVIVPNGCWDDAIKLSTPTLDNGSSLIFDGQSSAVFPGGNEYRKIEHLSTFEGGLGIESTIKSTQLIQQRLYPSTIQQNYVYREDLNGRSFVYSLDTSEENETDYHLMTFTLPSSKILSGDIVLYGQYFERYPKAKRTMQYDPEQKAYTLTLPIKMGYQEYQYRLIKGKTSEDKEQSYVEGNYSQTSNEYTVLVYERKPTDRTDALVGTKVISR